MKSSHICLRAVIASLATVGIGLAGLPVVHADPNDTDPPGQPAIPAPAVAEPAAAEVGDNSAAVAACSQMSGAMAYAASNYSDFANEMSVAKGDYSDAIASGTNASGRTALRQAAVAANDAANTPGLQPEVAEPIRAWSGDATKLILLMGLRIPQDSVNGKVNDLNTDAYNVRMACAQAGTHA